MKILSKYRIMYPSYNTTQVKNLVSHDDYKAVVNRQNELIRLIANYDKNFTGYYLTNEGKKAIKEYESTR